MSDKQFVFKNHIFTVASKDPEVTDHESNMTMPVHARYFCVNASRDALFDVYMDTFHSPILDIRQTFAKKTPFDMECEPVSNKSVSSNRSVIQFWARNNETLFDISRITVRIGKWLIKYFYIYHIGESKFGLSW